MTLSNTHNRAHNKTHTLSNTHYCFIYWFWCQMRSRAFIRCHRDKYSLPGLHPVYRLHSLGSGAVRRNGRLKGRGIMAGYKRAVIVITGVYKARAALYGPSKSFIRPSVAQSEKERFLFEKRPSGLFSRWPRTHTPRSVPHSPNFIIFFFSSLLFFV